VYQKFIAEPKQLEAAEMFVAQQNFQQDYRWYYERFII
jgi:hypothetical protein